MSTDESGGNEPSAKRQNSLDNSASGNAEEKETTAVVDELFTLDQLIKMDEEREDTALALLGGSLDLVCTYTEGYKIRQPLYSCKTCLSKTGKLAGICYACSENCHDGHDLVELYTKRGFCCDCGNSKFETKCKLFEVKDSLNKRNKYNDNFKGIFCSCKKAYPPDENDADMSEEDMFQCCICEDWFHPSHIFPSEHQEGSTTEEAVKDLSDDIETLICKGCMSNYSFLTLYPFANGPMKKCDELSANGNKNVEEENGKKNACKLKAFKKQGEANTTNGEDRAKSVWAPVGWREELCRCEDCLNLYYDMDCAFLLEPEDTLAFFEQQNREKASKKSTAKNDLFQLVVEETKERETALKMLMGIEQMQQHCIEFFGKRAAEKRGPITGEDVEQCFAELRAKRMKHSEEGAQQDELDKPGNGPWTQANKSNSLDHMGRHKKTQKFRNKLQKLIKPTDDRIKGELRVKKSQKEDENALKIKEAPKISAAMFLKYNTQLGPPFHVIIDTNFVNFSIKNRIDMMTGFMDCLYAKVVPYISDCVLGELEKMGRRFKLALKIIKDSRFQRLQCSHNGIYADDCIVQRVTQHKCYIVATCDKDLRQRIRKIPGVPIMYIRDHRYTIERMPDAYGAPKLG